MTPFLINFSVAHLDRAAAFYQEILGYQCVSEGMVQSEDHRRLWRMEPELHCHFVALKGDCDAPMLRLIEFDRNGEPIWGRYHHLGDMGIFCLDLVSAEPDLLHQRIRANGGRARTVASCRDETYRGRQFLDPDGVLCIVHHGQNQEPRIHTVSLHIRDPETSISFYQGLGFRVVGDETNPAYAAFLGLPHDVSVRHIDLLPDDSSGSGLRLLHYETMGGRSLRGRAIPPNKGLLSLGFPTTDLEGSCARMTELIKRFGGCHISGPLCSNDREPASKSASFLGPDGEMIELCDH